MACSAGKLIQWTVNTKGNTFGITANRIKKGKRAPAVPDFLDHVFSHEGAYILVYGGTFQHAILAVNTGDPATSCLVESNPVVPMVLEFSREALASMPLGAHPIVTEVVRLTDLRAAKPALASTKRPAPFEEPRTKKRHRTC